jgi:hypothetical protein
MNQVQERDSGGHLFSEYLGFIKGGEFLNELPNYSLIRRDFAICSLFIDNIWRGMQL